MGRKSKQTELREGPGPPEAGEGGRGSRIQADRATEGASGEGATRLHSRALPLKLEVREHEGGGGCGEAPKAWVTARAAARHGREASSSATQEGAEAAQERLTQSRGEDQGHVGSWRRGERSAEESTA